LPQAQYLYDCGGLRKRNEGTKSCLAYVKSPASGRFGQHVSHANNRTKRRFMPNLHYRRFWVDSEKRWVRLRITNAALRLIDKLASTPFSLICVRAGEI